MQNKWMILMGLWVAFIGLCFYYVDKSISAMMIICLAAGVGMLVAFVVTNIIAAKHRREIK